MSKSSIVVPVFVLLAVVLLISEGYLIFKPENIGENHKDKEEILTSIEKSTNLEEYVDFKIKVLGAYLKPTTKPKFKVGQVFKYKAVSESNGEWVSSENVYVVKKIERINGIDNYVIVGYITQMLDPETGDILHENIKLTTYVDKETGYIPKIGIEFGAPMDVNDKKNFMEEEYESEPLFNVTLKEDVASASGNGMYAPWMLALKENLEWSQKINITFSGEEISGEEKYKVIGIENLNGRECFKVEAASVMELPGGTSQRILFKQDLWIDAYERILVKSKGKIGNLATEEIELVYST